MAATNESTLQYLTSYTTYEKIKLTFDWFCLDFFFDLLANMSLGLFIRTSKAIHRMLV